MSGESSLGARAYRDLVGHFATGVTVITMAGEAPRGMTANAITSVSLDPLLLLICVDKSAHAHEQLDKAGSFAVNILAVEQEEISKTFAVSSEPEQGMLRGVPYRLGPHGSPVLEGCLAYVECEVSDRFVGGDHTLFMGAVLGGELLREAAPLLFYQGRYQRIKEA